MFKVGDEVECISLEQWEQRAGCKIGGVYEIKEVTYPKSFRLKGRDYILQASNFKLVEEKAMEFKVGDRVKIAKGSQYYGADTSHNPEDVVGVIDYSSGDSITVDWPDGHNSYAPEDLELVEEERFDLSTILPPQDMEGGRKIDTIKWSVGKRKRKGKNTIVCTPARGNPLVVGCVDDEHQLCAILLQLKKETEEGLNELPF